MASAHRRRAYRLVVGWLRLLGACQGGRLSERWTDDRGREVLTSGEVLWLAAPRMLELTWADDDWDASTRVLFELVQGADATHLTLTHSGWEAIPSSGREGLIREHASGWSRHMANLEAHLRGALG